MSANNDADCFDQWAIVDVMGHQRYVGRVTEQVIAGQGFVRVDIPEAEGRSAWSKMIGPGSIYAITPVSEEIARAMASKRAAEPISIYDLPKDPQRHLDLRTADDPDFDDDDDDDEPF